MVVEYAHMHRLLAENMNLKIESGIRSAIMVCKLVQSTVTL